MAAETPCLLFVYGLLQPGFHPPRTMRSMSRSRMRGRLYDLGEYPAGVELGNADSWIEGWLLTIDEEELTALDEFEELEGEGYFVRIQASTETGEQAWVYKYEGIIPAGLKPLSRWPSKRES